MKWCYRCLETKSESDFYKSSSTPDSLRRECKLCSNRLSKEYQQKNYDPSKQQEYRYKYRYGLTPSDWMAMYQEQGGMCAICTTLFPPERKLLYVDHDHRCCPGRVSCGKCIRGLLCRQCNVGVSYHEDEFTVKQVQKYLREHGVMH